MTTTIKKIAQQLKVNPSTVSRALSGSKQISPATREKVLQVASTLNYSPNLWAQNLVGSAINLIGCLVLELTNPFYIPVLRAVEDEAGEQGFIVFLSESRRQIKNEKIIIDRFRRIRVGGVIITPVMTEIDHLNLLKSDGVPVVVAARNIQGFDSINVDNCKSGMIAGQYLVKLGHLRIGFIQSGDPYNLPEQHRSNGLIFVLKENGLNGEISYKVGHNDVSGGERAAEMWQEDVNRPTAVFCSNDLLAMGFIQKAIRMGIKIPGDVSVVGHDDILFADSFIIPLTTIALPKYNLGRLAMQILNQRIQEKGKSFEPQQIALEPELVERNSSRNLKNN